MTIVSVDSPARNAASFEKSTLNELHCTQLKTVYRFGSLSKATT